MAEAGIWNMGCYGALIGCLHHESAQFSQKFVIWLLMIESGLVTSSGKTMRDKQFLENLSDRISQLLPRANELGEDARTAVQQLVQKTFNELNILTQDEFEARERALARAEQRVEQLETEIRELEQRLDRLTTPTTTKPD